MRLPNTAHTVHPWVINRVAHDFELLDVWGLPVEGTRDDFDAFLDAIGSVDPVTAGSAASRFLFAIRLRVGSWLGWDDVTERRPIPGCTETTLAERLPEDFRGSATARVVGGTMQRAAGGFVPLYQTADEWAGEISNETVHGILHLGWAPRGEGRYRGQLAVYVKPRGRLGAVYLKLIEPFRHLVVYPALTRQVGRAWDMRGA